MAYDEGLAEILRDALSDTPGISEKRMFGGLCFLLNGNMVCGVHKGGGMFRVGKEQEAAALAIPGAAPLSFTGRKMGGMVEVTDDGMGNDDTRGALLTLALGFAKTLPPK
ncbi:hypothetical protein ACMU_07240 [Actibacterium mucosum KCTC 23349]|uniref:TfoX N-terminal domain-containing protein n=1 Tax=Actibacterium mucosum KCTC 23349 TaxID=1454373 RepID=A0A037ZJV3_9RHOB|nr:TfoX/Sxy family protein [Actibacterium mucosum]KAJ56725.1 hypothetical protein ACMU_07240 [Actibacterium mucosum KCTC 23349]